MIRQCNKCGIVHDNRVCPFCNLREHDNIGHIDNLALNAAERLVSEYVVRALAAPDGRTEPRRLPKFIAGELVWLRKGIDEDLRAIAADAILSIAAACVCCQARTLTEAGDV